MLIRARKLLAFFNKNEIVLILGYIFSLPNGYPLEGGEAFERTLTVEYPLR